MLKSIVLSFIYVFFCTFYVVLLEYFIETDRGLVFCIVMFYNSVGKKNTAQYKVLYKNQS